MRNKGVSLINISGLAMGMASAMLILLWIQHEVSYDRFHEKKDRIYEAWNRAVYDGELQCWNTTPKILGPTLQKDFPEIETVARVNWSSNFLFTVGDKNLTVQGNMVDSAFLEIFSFPLLKGNPRTVLNDVSSIVLTEKLAEKLFGNEDPMGKMIRIENEDNFTVTGVLKDLPNNTRFDFEYLLPWSFLRKKGWDDENWGNNSTRNYVLLKPRTSLTTVQEKMKALRERYDKNDPEAEMFLYPVSRWRLYSNFKGGIESGGLVEMVRMFGIIAGLILLIACINFMNLATARSEKRSKEVGIRKVVGAQKGGLIGQFLGESVLVTFIAGILALLLVQISLPGFNQLTGKKLFIDYGSLTLWLFFAGFILFTGIIACSYPAFYLSSFRPIKVLKGTFRNVTAHVTPRKVLVVIQFSISIVLIISTIIIRQQINHAQERETGYNKNNLVYHSLTGDLDKNYTLLKNELLSSGIATAVSKTSAPLTEGWSNTWGIEWPGKDPNDKTIIDRFCADENLAETAGLQIIEGRDLNLREYPTDSSGVLLNESAVKVMGFEQPIGQIIKDNGKDWHVVGVFRDFILQSPFYPTAPMVIEGAKGWFNVIHFKLNDAVNTAANLKNAEALFKKYNPEYPFDYKFVDEEYARKFNSEQRIAWLASLFAGLTILISCLGLFGLAAYMAETRVREIGVRKVLGASVTNITTLLSKDFLKLVLIAFLVATPVAWWAMHYWLQKYPYHVNIQWWVFALAGVLSVIIALCTVSYQAVKAAMANPVKSLRSE